MSSPKDNNNLTQEPQINTTLADLRTSLQHQEPQLRLMLPLAIGGILVALLGAFIWWDQQKTPPMVTIYVAPAENNASWQSAAFNQSLRSELGDGVQLALINPTFTQTRGADDYSRYVALSDVTLIVQEHTSQSSPGFKVQLTRNGQVPHNITAINVPRANRNFDQLAEQTVKQIREVLNISEFDTPKPKPRIASQENVIKLLAEAELAMNRYDAAIAVEKLEQAFVLAPQNSFVSFTLAKAYTKLGREAQAKTMADNALLSLQNLPRHHQLSVQAFSDAISGRWENAIKLMQARQTFFPHNVEYALELAAAHRDFGQFDQALEVTTTLRNIYPPTVTDPRADLADAAIHREAGRYKLATSKANSAIEKAMQLGANSIVAESIAVAVKVDESLAADEATQLLNDGLLMARNAKNPALESMLLNELGIIAFHAGDLQLSITHLKSAERLAQRTGSQNQLASSRNLLARSYDLLGDLELGLEMKQGVLDYFVANNREPRVALMLENIGISQRKLGQLEAAKTSFATARKSFVEIQELIGLAWSPYYQATVARMQGDLVTARRFAQESLTASDTRPEGNLRLVSLEELAEIAYLMGEFKLAQNLSQQVFDGYHSQGESIYAAYGNVMIGRGLANSGHWQKARTEYTRALAVARKQEAIGLELYALTYLVELDLQQNTQSLEDCQSLNSRANQTQQVIYKYPALAVATQCLHKLEFLTFTQAASQLNQLYKQANSLGVVPGMQAIVDAEVKVWKLSKGALPDSVQNRQNQVSERWTRQ